MASLSGNGHFRTRMLITLTAKVKIKYKENEINLMTNKLPTRVYKSLKLVLTKPNALQGLWTVSKLTC